MKTNGQYYSTVSQLFAAHDADTPLEYASEAYDRTDCGVWTTFLTMEGPIPSADLEERQNRAPWPANHIVGVRHGTTVEGSDAEFKGRDLFFPFSDEELAAVWQECEDFFCEVSMDEESDD